MERLLRLTQSSHQQLLAKQSSSPISLGVVILPDNSRSAANISLTTLLPVPSLVETFLFLAVGSFHINEHFAWD